MITLKTLEKATKQEIFDQVSEHLLMQMKKSETNDKISCLYRGLDGLKCAAGCLIADDEYFKIMEWNEWNTLVEQHLVPNYHKELIQELQNIHDNYNVCNWKNTLRNFSIENNLEWKF